jgi:hypothetical protein
MWDATAWAAVVGPITTMMSGLGGYLLAGPSSSRTARARRPRGSCGRRRGNCRDRIHAGSGGLRIQTDQRRPGPHPPRSTVSSSATQTVGPTSRAQAQTPPPSPAVSHSGRVPGSHHGGITLSMKLLSLFAMARTLARTLHRDKSKIPYATTSLSIAQGVSIALGVSIAQRTIRPPRLTRGCHRLTVSAPTRVPKPAPFANPQHTLC